MTGIKYSHYLFYVPDLKLKLSYAFFESTVNQTNIAENALKMQTAWSAISA